MLDKLRNQLDEVLASISYLVIALFILKENVDSVVIRKAIMYISIALIFRRIIISFITYLTTKNKGIEKGEVLSLFISITLGVMIFVNYLPYYKNTIYYNTNNKLDFSTYSDSTTDVEKTYKNNGIILNLKRISVRGHMGKVTGYIENKSKKDIYINSNNAYIKLSNDEVYTLDHSRNEELNKVIKKNKSSEITIKFKVPRGINIEDCEINLFINGEDNTIFDGELLTFKLKDE